MADVIPCIPSLNPVLSLVIGAVRSPNTKRAYRAAITDFLCWCRDSGCAHFSKAAVQEYRSAPSCTGSTRFSYRRYLIMCCWA